MSDLLQALIISGCLGALIGLERQWDEQFHHPRRGIPAGVRTFTLWALVGALCAYFGRELHPAVFVTGLVAIGAFAGILLLAKHREGPTQGFTTATVAVLTYFLGALVVWEHVQEAVFLTVLVLILLASKPYLHSISKKFTQNDVRMALQFAAVTGIVLPLVPDQDFGPFDAFNPRSTWMMVVIVSSLGFAGYVAVRLFGASLGIVLTGLVGGLASSTATTLAMSRQSKVQAGFDRDFSLAVLLACTVMLWRVAFLVVVISPALLQKLWPALAVMSVPGVVYAGLRFLRRGKEDHARAEIKSYKNPLSLKIALQFAALYAIIVFLVKALGNAFGGAGIYAVSFISGLTDLDAISLSLSKTVAGHSLDVGLAARGLVIAAVSNTVLKGALAISLGSPEFRRRVALLLGVTAALGAASLFLVR